MTGETNDQAVSHLPSISHQKKKNERKEKFDDDTASIITTASKSRRPFNEKIVYRKSTLPNLSHQNAENEIVYDHAECPRCHSVISIKLSSKQKDRENNDEALRIASRHSVVRSRQLPRKATSANSFNDAASVVSCNDCTKNKTLIPERTNSPQKTYIKKGKLYRSVDPNVDWTDLNDKIEEWFEYAKTPDQKVVYGFLNELKPEDENDETSSVHTEKITNKVKSLEDILDNLKKYRHKFHRPSHSRSAALPKITARSNSKLNNLFESSTWRVMRHIRSVDVRNKYPLPKANPDEYFRNSTVFHVAGRVPNSTFLLHPEWV